MHFAKLAAPLALAGLVAASPVDKRAYAPTDADILNYALTLEHLEATFYALGLNMLNAGAFEDAGFADWVRYRFTEIASQEATHVSFLTAALTAAGAEPVAACKYDFGITTPESYRALSQVLEGVGVAAYLGAAPLISSKAYLGVAGSILVVEAEHDTWVRSAASNQDAFPGPFYPPLDLSQAYTLASAFITSCPSSNVALPVMAFPTFKVETTGPYYVGQKIVIEVPKGAKYAAFVAASGTIYQPVSAGTSTITISPYATGQSYLILTDSEAQTDAATIAGPVILEIPVAAADFTY
ncbi:MAG: hypothetical protein CYPHOPRED_000912 [Cyphobasidiales sp. Tagirdzhanova-0007]|nr:MAG: hypothetical protein CYPHOPRED_000912 [Cyphobasidiales sp. Tagirdzhanova-0007]